MYKKKPLFITFEGIEGSGKSYQSKKLYNKLKKMGIPAILTREPGGTPSAEKIRKVILDDYFHPDIKEKFNKNTDTLLYLAARNEHISHKIKPAILKRKIVILLLLYTVTSKDTFLVTFPNGFPSPDSLQIFFAGRVYACSLLKNRRRNKITSLKIPYFVT